MHSNSQLKAVENRMTAGFDHQLIDDKLLKETLSRFFKFVVKLTIYKNILET